MFFDYYEKIVAEQRKMENPNNETETKLKKAKKLAKKKQPEVFNDIDDNDESSEKEVIEKESED